LSFLAGTNTGVGIIGAAGGGDGGGDGGGAFFDLPAVPACAELSTFPLSALAACRSVSARAICLLLASISQSVYF
jgi:hypothetical protein